MTSLTASTTSSSAANAGGAAKLFAALIGLSSIAVLLQGVWAGLFIREGKSNDDTWVQVHARCADVAILLAAIATVVVIAKLRDYRALVASSVAFTVLLVVEAYLGGLVGNNNAIEIIHFPLAMALIGLAVYLPLQSRSLIRSR